MEQLEQVKEKGTSFIFSQYIKLYKLSNNMTGPDLRLKYKLRPCINDLFELCFIPTVRLDLEGCTCHKCL